MRSPRTPGTSLGENSVQRNFFSAEHNMEIQNLKRRNAEHALFESQRELEPQRWQILEANQLADQAQRETIHLCSELKMKNRLHQESYARSCQKFEELKRSCYQEDILKNNKDWKNLLCSMIRNHVRWVYWAKPSTKITRTIGIFEDSKIFHDPDWLSSYDGPAFLIKLSLLRVQESLAAILECCEIHGKIWVFQETFLVVNMLDEILMNCAMIREIWRRCWVFWEQKELRKVKAENHCSRHLYLALPTFRQKVWTVEVSYVHD